MLAEKNRKTMRMSNENKILFVAVTHWRPAPKSTLVGAIREWKMLFIYLFTYTNGAPEKKDKKMEHTLSESENIVRNKKN
ncbi:hypothetical protein RB195_015034 [Necator americanus]|uniref:Uncharacterized protein n=1 Tax=Necator americanus TaxID=51031 RepID=A0ABR1E365_NECAM